MTVTPSSPCLKVLGYPLKSFRHLSRPALESPPPLMGAMLLFPTETPRLSPWLSTNSVFWTTFRYFLSRYSDFSAFALVLSTNICCFLHIVYYSVFCFCFGFDFYLHFGIRRAFTTKECLFQQKGTLELFV